MKENDGINGNKEFNW